MKYTPDPDGKFAGQQGYGYQSFEHFVKASKEINQGVKLPQDFNRRLPTAESCLIQTAIMEAGRISIDKGKKVLINYENNNPTSLSVV